MDRNFYYIGIAFFGMVNGLFNQVALLFSLIHLQILAPSLLFGSGATGDSTPASLWVWLAGTAVLTLPAIGNFFEFGL